MRTFQLIHRRLLAASCVALIGVGAVVWTGVRLFGGQGATIAGADSLPELPPEYRDGPALIPATEDTPGAIGLDTVHASLNRTVVSKRDVFAGVGAEAQRKFADAAWLAMAPVLTGSFEDYLESARLLGADPDKLMGSNDREDFDAVQEQWDLCQSHNPVVGLLSESVAIESFANRGIRRAAFQDVLRLMRSGYSKMGNASGGSTYPGVDNYITKKLNAVELRCLTEMEIDGERHEVVVGVALAWDPFGRRWQPIEQRRYYKQDVIAVLSTAP